MLRDWVLVVAILGLVAGCASTPGGPDSKPTKAGPGGVMMHEDKDLDWVWAAAGFSFAAYDTVYVAEARANVPALKPDDAESLEWARGLLRERLVRVLREAKLFATVVERQAEIRPDARVLRLEAVIVEYGKGDAATRAFVGVAGHPLIRVQGSMLDGDRQMFAFEEKRGGAGIRPGAGFRSNRDLQQSDLTDLSENLADHIARATGRRR